MAKKRQGKNMQEELIKLIYYNSEQGLNQTQISKSLGISRACVQDYQNAAKLSGKSYQELQSFFGEELYAVLQKKRIRSKEKQYEIDYALASRELSRKGVTRQLLWEELVESQGIDLSYSTFCRRLEEHQEHHEYTFRQDHKAGEKSFLDFSGLTLNYYQQREEFKAQIFVATLGASNYTYVEATRDQKIDSWIEVNINSYEFFGGVTEIQVPDNLKSGVNKASFYEPEINLSYAQLAKYYNTVIIPARSRKPKDKAKVEKAVQDIERQILAPLRNTRFFSVYEINQAIKLLLEKYNNKKMQVYDISRKELFEKTDKPVLKPLPAARYIAEVFHKAKVHVDYHVEYQGHYYSVPYKHTKKEVMVRSTSKIVRIFLNDQCIAEHEKSSSKGQHSTKTEHMPPKYQKFKKSSTPDYFLWWSSQIGIEAHTLVQRVLKSREHEEIAIRALFGFKRLFNTYPDRFEAACKRANHFKIIRVQQLKSILDQGLDKQPLPVEEKEEIITSHSNLRGDIFK